MTAASALVMNASIVLAFMTGFIAVDAALADAWDEESAIVAGSLAIAAIWCRTAQNHCSALRTARFPALQIRARSAGRRALIWPVHHVASVPAIMSIVNGTIASVPRIFMQTAVSPECAHMPQIVITEERQGQRGYDGGTSWSEPAVARAGLRAASQARVDPGCMTSKSRAV